MILLAGISDQQSKKILLVEDNPDDVELTKRGFKKQKFDTEIVVACDGVEALDYLFGENKYAGRDTGIVPDLILLDLKMPKLNGLEVLQRLRSDERTRLIPVVILTTSDEKQDMVNGYNLGANSYIRKPVDSEDFNRALEQLGVYWITLNEPPPKLRN